MTLDVAVLAEIRQVPAEGIDRDVNALGYLFLGGLAVGGEVGQEAGESFVHGGEKSRETRDARRERRGEEQKRSTLGSRLHARVSALFQG